MKGYSQVYMAKKLFMSQSKYSRIESSGRKITPDLQKRIADVLQVPIAAFTDDNAPANNPVSIAQQARDERVLIMLRSLVNMQENEIRRLADLNKRLVATITAEDKVS